MRSTSGPGWIRTNVGLRQRVYSPFPLATRAPTHTFIIRISRILQPNPRHLSRAKKGKPEQFAGLIRLWTPALIRVYQSSCMGK